MAFKIPKLWPPRKKIKIASETRENLNLPTTDVSDFDRLETIGSGSYGVISLCKSKKDGSELIRKELLINDGDSERLFLKEARILNMAQHKNVVKFHSVCFSAKTSILMEYVYFDLKCFGQISKLSSLKDMLTFIDDYNYDKFEHFPQCIAEDVCEGLNYLHSKDIVHRDLKPDNILVSNQHYLSLDDAEQNKCWNNKPVVAKLTDFGECRTSLIQTGSLIHTRTSNVFRGTPAYMAPEIFLHNEADKIGLNEMKSSDVWSFAMVLFALMNPDIKYPYQLEFNRLKSNKSAKEVLSEIFTLQRLPQHSSKYEKHRVEYWKRICTVYYECAKFVNRPTMNQVMLLLTKKERSRNLFSDLISNSCQQSNLNAQIPLLEADKKMINVTEEEELDIVEDTSEEIEEGEHIQNPYEKPKGPLSSLLDLPSIKPSAEFDLDTLKDEEGDEHGQQLRQGRKEFMKDRRGGQDRSSLDGNDRNDRDRDLGRNRVRRRHDKDRHRRHDSPEDGERMIEVSLIDLQERLDPEEREKMDMNVDDRNMDNKPGLVGNQGPPAKVPLLGNQGLMGNLMGSNQGMMGNQQGIIRNNQKGMIGNNQGMMGNQNNMMGENHPGMIGNQMGMRGTNPGMMGNQMGGPMNQQGMTGNRMTGPQGLGQIGIESSEPLGNINRMPTRQPVMSGLQTVADEIQKYKMSQDPSVDQGSQPQSIVMGEVGSSDSEKAKVDKLKSVFGTFHQASENIFKHAAAGTQCSAISMMAVILGSIKRTDQWTSNDIDNILLEGDKFHMSILQETEWPYGRKESKLDLDEFPDIITCNINDMKITTSIGLKNEAVYGFTSEIYAVVLQALKKKPSSSFIIRMHDKCRAILNNCSGHYSIFDPHACNEYGLTDPNGFACVLHFNDVSDMLDYLKWIVKGKRDEQVDISPIDIELLSLEKESDYTNSSCNSEKIQENSKTEELLEETSTLSDSISCSVYCRRSKGLNVKEIISLCVFDEIEETKICQKVPSPSKNAVFILDLSAIDIKDITCDDSGIYDCHSSPSTVIKANMEGNEILDISTISRKKVDINETILKESNVFTIKRMYSEQKRDNSMTKASRIISRVYSQGKPARFAIVQYIGERISHTRPHKNSKSKDTYLRTKPSVITKEKYLAAEVAPKQVINIIDSSNDYDSASDGPRNRQQVYNVKKQLGTKFKARNTGKVKMPDFAKLVATMDNSDFLKDVDFSYRQKFNRIHPNTFAATDNSLLWLKTFCSTDSEIKSQLGIDMTYKVGPFFTTCLSFPHPVFVHKNDRQKHPSVFVGMMTSTGRQMEDYMYLGNQLKSRGINNLIYGTDGEYALELGMELVFPIEGVTPEKRSIKLRCFNHLSDNLDMELKKYDVNRSDVITSILGREYAYERIPGLVDCSTTEFEGEYKKLSVKWPEDFKHYIESKDLKVRSIKETLKKCMIKEIRKAAGLGNPPNKYDNQRAESMNAVLKETLDLNLLIKQLSMNMLMKT